MSSRPPQPSQGKLGRPKKQGNIANLFSKMQQDTNKTKKSWDPSCDDPIDLGDSDDDDNEENYNPYDPTAVTPKKKSVKTAKETEDPASPIISRSQRPVMVKSATVKSSQGTENFLGGVPAKVDVSNVQDESDSDAFYQNLVLGAPVDNPEEENEEEEEEEEAVDANLQDVLVHAFGPDTQVHPAGGETQYQGTMYERTMSPPPEGIFSSFSRSSINVPAVPKTISP